MSDRTIHFAMFKWKPDAPIEEIERIPEDQKAKIVGTIPGVRSFEWGRNRSAFSHGYSHALLVVADEQNIMTPTVNPTSGKRPTRSSASGWMATCPRISASSNRRTGVAMASWPRSSVAKPS